MFSTRAARRGTLHEITEATPIPIIAEVLGYSPATIERHAVASASTYARYIGGTSQPNTGGSMNKSRKTQAASTGCPE